MNFQEKLDTYARLLVIHGLNVQPGQEVYINSEIMHRDFVFRIAQEAYRCGAKYVNVDFMDPQLLRLRILESRQDKHLEWVPRHIPVKYEEMVAEKAASLRLTGSEFPDCLADLSPSKVNTYQLSLRQNLRKYYEEGVGKSKVHWLVAAAATPKWGEKVYPELSEDKACEALWEAIFKICRADKPDCLDQWKKHNEILHRRAQKLSQLKIKELHFLGPKTDLKVGLSPRAVFKGGGDLGPYGVEFSPNIPTEECFTTPDWRLTEGKVQTTRPFFVNGKLIKNLYLEFKNGCITYFSASEGQASFAEYINSDAGAKRLGEVSLVGIDSPIYQSGRVFQEILFDENAACHIAIGFAYRFCLEGGTSMRDEELEAVGCNTSHVHTDMMISSEEVDVHAYTYTGKNLELICKGKWVDF